MKKINFPIISTVLFIITAVVTIFLFYYLSEEKTRSSLFIFNLAYICFLELLFWLHRINQIFKSSYECNIAVGGSLIISYIVIATVIVISYNLFLNQFLANKFYISTIIIGTTLTVILYGFLIKLDTHHTTNEEINKSKD